MTGTVKNITRERGFGFIKGENDVEYFSIARRSRGFVSKIFGRVTG